MPSPRSTASQGRAPQSNILEPFFVSKAEAVRLLGSKKLVERMLYSVNQGLADKWLTVVTHNPDNPFGSKSNGKGKLISLESIKLAAERLKNGEFPPRFPSQVYQPPTHSYKL
jgi:hypothetical protein